MNMKKIIIPALLITATLVSQAQRCLDMRISDLVKSLPVPDNGPAALRKCLSEKGDHEKIYIKHYGTDLVQLDTGIAQAERKFAVASAPDMAGYSANMPNQQDMSDAKALAEKLKTMTPEQQKEFGMQMAAQSKASQAAPVDNSAVIRMVLQAQDLAVRQMTPASREFNTKFHDLQQQCEQEIQALPRPDKSKCPTDVTGMVDCKCANHAEAVYWKKAAGIQEKYNLQKTELYKSYLAHMGTLAAQVDATVAQLHHGDDIQSTNYKRTLVSAQGSAYANAYGTSVEALKEIRKSGSDVGLNQQNAEHGVYDISCSHL